MSDFKFSCPNCDQHIAGDESYYGLQINCPTCTTSIIVPVGHESARRTASSAPIPHRLRLSKSAPALALAGRQSGEGESGRQAEDSSAVEAIEEREPSGIFGMFEQLESTAKEVRVLPELKQPRPGRLQGFKAFFIRAGRAIRLIFTEKELIVFSLLQWSAIGIAYYVWVQILGWIPEETWRTARESKGLSMVDIIFAIWSLLCIGLAAFPLGILSGCMGAVHFLNRQGQESTIARCLQIVMPHAFRLWIFHWMDAAYTCKQILERLPKKRDDDSPRMNRALSEALYYAWKLGTAGVMPGLLLGKSFFAAGKASVLLIKDRFLDMALLRAGYSGLCWVVGILVYIGSLYFFWATGIFEKNQGVADGIQIHHFYQLAGVPILVAAGAVLLFLRPVFVISLCEIYSEEMETRGEQVELAAAPGKVKAILVAFAVLAVIVMTGGLYLQPLLKNQRPAESEPTQLAAESSASKPQPDLDKVPAKTTLATTGKRDSATAGVPEGFASPEDLFRQMKASGADDISLILPAERPALAYTFVGMARLIVAFQSNPNQKQEVESAFTALIEKYHLADKLEFSDTEDEAKIAELAAKAFTDVDLKAFMTDVSAFMEKHSSISDAAAEPRVVAMKDLKINGKEARATIVSSDATEQLMVFVQSNGRWFLSLRLTSE